MPSVMACIERSKHSAIDRLNVILRLSPKTDCDQSLATLDALHTHIFYSVENDLSCDKFLALEPFPGWKIRNWGNIPHPKLL
jgi:hypothetical protein